MTKEIDMTGKDELSFDEILGTRQDVDFSIHGGDRKKDGEGKTEESQKSQKSPSENGKIKISIGVLRETKKPPSKSS